MDVQVSRRKLAAESKKRRLSKMRSLKGGGAGVILLLLHLGLVTPAAAQIVFTTPPSSVTVAMGSPARFDCAFTASNPTSIIWRKDGSAVTPSTRFSYLINNSLLIDPTESGDNGTYTCVVTDQTTQAVVMRSGSLTFALIMNSFSTNPESQTVNEGDTLLLFCVHGGSVPPASITWTLNGNVVSPSFRIRIRSLVLGHTAPPQVTSTLAIISTATGDAGMYRCVATNALFPGSDVQSQQATIAVRGSPQPPSILQHPTDVILASAGLTATFTCSASGEPTPTFTWTHNGTQVPSPQGLDGTSRLNVTNVQMEDTGTYLCTAINSQGTAISNPAQLQLASISSSFLLQPVDTLSIIGADVRIDCLPPVSVPPATVTWTKNFAQLPDSRFQVLQNGSLAISSVQLLDQGVYHCTATNPLLGVSRTSVGVALTALGLPTITPNSTTISLGQSGSFVCQAQGDPPPTITWFKAANQITVNTPRVVLSANRLTVTNVTLQDDGYYTCRAVFPRGTTEAQAFLDVMSAPILLNASLSLTAVAGSILTLPCSVRLPDPSLSFQWLLDSQPLNPMATEDLELLSNGSLVIANVETSMEGTFLCVASNTLGTVRSTVVVNVVVPPTVVANTAVLNATQGSTVALMCMATGDPVLVITWFRNGTEVPSPGTPRYRLASNGSMLVVQGVEEGDEGTFRCIATNPAGTDQDTVTLTVLVAPSVRAIPATQQLMVGSTATFSCSATGDPTPSLRWLNAASIDVTSLGDPRIQVLSGGSLVIGNVGPGDTQQYVCEASSPVGTAIAAVSLNVLVAPTVTLPATTTVIQGEQLLLNCQPTGNPTPTIIWRRDNVEIQSGGRVTVGSNGTLVITNVFSSDGGNYSCHASSSVGTDSTRTIVTVLVVPVIQQMVFQVIANEGATAVLDCIATGSPLPTVTWFQNSVRLPNPGIPRIRQESNNSLIVSDIVKRDEGPYICQATNLAGTESATTQLRVYVAPMVMALDASITAVQGNTITLTCVVVSSDPSPIFTWLRNGSEVPSPGTPRYQLASNGSMLIVRGVEEGDEGTFRCIATNPAGTDQDIITLTVLVPPTFTQVPTNSTAIENTRQHTLTCAATGDPTPLITWSRDGTIQSTQGTLIFSLVSRNDTGNYTCTASNGAGQIRADVFLDVQYSPSILQPPTSISVPLGRGAQLVCIPDGNPDPQISWLFQGTQIAGAEGPIYSIAMVTGIDGGQYTCMASNVIGNTSAMATLTVLFPPSAPTIGVVMATSSTSITVQWAASTNDGGSPITGYVVEYRVTSDTGSQFAMQSFGSGVLNTTLTALVPFTTYDVRVRGQNAVGPSDPSATLQRRTDPDVPVAPGNFRVLSSTSTTLTLAWTLPDPLNGMFGAYELQYGIETDFLSGIISMRLLFTTQFTVSGIQANMIYRLQVRASTVSLSGETLWGPFSTLRVRNGVELEIPTEPPTLLPSPSPSPSPTIPTSPSQSPTGTTETEMTETISTQPSQPLPSSSSSSSQLITSQPVLPPITETSSSLVLVPIPLTTLPPSTSTQTQQTTPPPSPTPTPSPLTPPTVVPALVLALVQDVAEILVYWREPLSGLDTFDGYQIFISPPPPPPLMSPIFVPVMPISGMYLLQGLANFTTYTITVATYNQDGLGPLTASHTATTPEAAPSAPRSHTITRLTSQSILVSWSPPNPRNGIILDYDVRVVVSFSGQLFTSRTVSVSAGSQDEAQFVTIDGLDLDRVRYLVTVSARTIAGRGPETEALAVGTQAPAPSAPRSHTITRLTSQSILVSWSPPNPRNGIILDYEVRVVVSFSGQLFTSRTVSVSAGSQDEAQFVTIDGLDLDRVRYLVTVSARTIAGRGPETEALAVGTQAPATDVPQRTTTTLPPSTTSIPPPPPTSQPPIPPTPTPPTITPSPTVVVTDLPTIEEERDEVYYIIRIAPPVAAAIILVLLLVVVTLIFCAHVGQMSSRKKRGMYQFSEFENEGELQLRNRQLDEEPVVSHDVETSNYYVKDALDANFTFAPGLAKSKMGEESSSEEDSKIDIGEALEEEGEGLMGTGVSMGRDAMEEDSPSQTLDRPSAWEPRPLHTPSDSQSTDSQEGTMSSRPQQKPVFNPGDQMYAEMDAVRARKARERAKRLGLGGGGGVFGPEMEMSSGGLLETRIGAVGVARGGGSNMGGLAPEASAQMY